MLGTTTVGGERVLASPILALHAGYAGVVAPDRDGTWGHLHDRASRERLLAQIAAYLGVPHGAPPSSRLLLVPGETIDASDVGQAVLADADILGGIVPHFFVGTKSIAHPLIDDDAARPMGWSTRMAALMGEAALDGYTAFSVADAARAGRRLLRDGPVRIKDVCGKAGLGQQVVRDAAALDAALALEDASALARCGIVLEQNLDDVRTYSVGSVQLGGESIAYWGSQNLTTDHHGREVYGGSDLLVVRGGFEALAALDLPDPIDRAVDCAATFDRAAHLAYPDIRLTRRNYDVIEGIDAGGRRRVAVLEQSWRVGGASGAEIAAFEALRAEPDTASVRCSTVELYAAAPVPPDATVYFAGVDPQVGTMTKYAMRVA